MIACKKCNNEALIATECCQRCGAPIQLDARETLEYVERRNFAKEKKEYEAYVEYLKILAWSGHTESEREYGRLLEKGDLVQRNYDEAMRFFYRAAKKIRRVLIVSLLALGIKSKRGKGTPLAYIFRFVGCGRRISRSSRAAFKGLL